MKYAALALASAALTVAGCCAWTAIDNMLRDRKARP